MNFDRTSVSRCIIPEIPPLDPRCDDAAFALSNPTLCNVGALIIKPAVVLFCVGDSMHFKVYEYKNGIETLLTDEVRFSSSNLDVLPVGVLSGSGTAIGAGVARITATHEDGREITSEVTVNAADACCEDIAVASAIVIDASRSMTLAFGGIYATRLNYAKGLANVYAGILGLVANSGDEDTGGGGQTGIPAIYEYISDPNIEAIVPDEPDLPALAYSQDGTGPIYGWNTSTHVWV